MTAPSRIVWNAVLSLAATALDVSAAEVGGPIRAPARAALARQLAYFLAVTALGWNASEAAMICGRDHPSVRSARRRLDLQRVGDRRGRIEGEAVWLVERGTGDALKVRAEVGKTVASFLAQGIEVVRR